MATRTLTPLRVVANQPQAANPDGRAPVQVYRMFFLAGIVTVLTVGCTLGAIALLGIAQQASYTATAMTPYVLAHANSQLYGWVGLFVMGFALQQHPPTYHHRKLFDRLAKISLICMAIGIGMRFVAEPLVRVERPLGVSIGVISALFQITSVGCFMANTTVTRHRASSALTWQTKFVFASLGWWTLVAIAEPVMFAFSHQADPTSSIYFVAEWFTPYREAQFLGFVTMMIFGVGLVKLNSCFGAKAPIRWSGEAGFWLWNGGLLVRMLGWVLAFRGGMTAESERLYFLGGSALASGAVLFLASSRLFEPLTSRLPSHKFMRAAFGWFAFSGLLLLVEPFWLRGLSVPFSHAFSGAMRHAITVGFISQMILGVGMHMVSQINDVAGEKRPEMWVTFGLLNAGNALRVFLELATDLHPAAFRVIGFSGFIELIGLTLWAIYMIRTMRTRRFHTYAV